MEACTGRPTTKIIKDVVHQFIELPADFVESIVDTPLVQRLRRVQQLSLAQMVYPGAVHTRFEHSLGVAYTIRKAIYHIVRNLRETVLPAIEARRPEYLDEEELMRVTSMLRAFAVELEGLEGEAVTAALLHDIGHIALSHISEQAANDYVVEVSPMRTEATSISVDHEALTIRIVNAILRDGSLRPCYNGRPVRMEVVNNILARAYAKGCSAVMRREADALDAAICIVAKLLSSNIDVDRADYILRDSIHTGNLAGIYDLNRYYAVLTVVPSVKRAGGLELHMDLGVLEKGVRIVENMLLARIYMYSDVYLHDVSMTYSVMASRLLALLSIAGLEALKDSEEGDSEAARLLERYPFIRYIAALDQLMREGSSLRDFEKVLSGLVDDEFYVIVYRMAEGGAEDLLGYVAGLDEKVGSRGWYREACLAMAAMAYGIAARRHISSIILYDDEKVGSIIYNLSERTQDVSDLVSPLIALSWSKYEPYSRGKEVKVFRKSSPLVPVGLEKSHHARLARELAGKAYAKLLISFLEPSKREAYMLPAGWSLRRGKLLAGDVASWMDSIGYGKACGLARGDVEAMALDAAERARKMVARLEGGGT